MKHLKNGFRGERSIVLPQMIIEMEKADPLVSSLYLTDIGYYPAASYHFRKREVGIDQHVLIYCVEGSGWYLLNGEQHQVKANQFFILPAGIPHSYGADSQDPWTIYWVHFTGAHSTFYATGDNLPRDVKPNINSRISDRNHIFEEIFSTLYEEYSLENLRYVSSLLHYYLASMRYLHLFRHAQSHDANEDTNVVKAAIHYMKENIEKKLSIEEVAKYTGYSASHFSALFQQQTQRSPLQYFNLLKVQQASLMLQETDMKINQICFKVGIEDSCYFSRLFTKVTGMSPTEYRKKTEGHSPTLPSEDKI